MADWSGRCFLIPVGEARKRHLFIVIHGPNDKDELVVVNFTTFVPYRHEEEDCIDAGVLCTKV
jgi:hypothetical protein